MNKDQLRKEMAENDFFPALTLIQDDDDGMYLMVLPNEEVYISYTPVKCIHAYGLAKNTIEYME
jgi:hypothetical protein